MQAEISRERLDPFIVLARRQDYFEPFRFPCVACGLQVVVTFFANICLSMFVGNQLFGIKIGGKKVLGLANVHSNA